MEVIIVRCGAEQALRLRRQMAPARPEMDAQIIVSDMWMARCAAGELALFGVVRAEAARLAWFITSPLLAARLHSFVPVARRFVQALAAADADRQLLVPVTARSGARLARVLGLRHLAACRDGVDYFTAED